MTRHELRLFPLACGLIVAVVAAAGLAGDRWDSRWILPAVLGLAGVLGIVAAVRSTLRESGVVRPAVDAAEEDAPTLGT